MYECIFPVNFNVVMLPQKKSLSHHLICFTFIMKRKNNLLEKPEI